MGAVQQVSFEKILFKWPLTEISAMWNSRAASSVHRGLAGRNLTRQKR
jgi:hypothetical protein